MQIYSKSMKNAASPLFRNHNRSALEAGTYITHRVIYYSLVKYEINGRNHCNHYLMSLFLNRNQHFHMRKLLLEVYLKKSTMMSYSERGELYRFVLNIISNINNDVYSIDECL